MTRRKSPQQMHRDRQLQSLQDGNHDLPGDFAMTPEALAAFIEKIHGRVLYPGDPGYDKARTEVNPAYPTFPKIIVFCISVGDVQACLELARANHLQVVARAGRHSLAGYSVCDGMVIDVSELNGVTIDPVAQTAVVGAGCPFERLNSHLQSFNLHVPGGGCPTVCIAGYMQGGGFGFTSRVYGLNSDNVVSFRMVLPDGHLVTATREKNPDLFWAVRGGTGSQFGVLTEVTYRLVPIERVWGIRLDWVVEADPEAAAQALETIQNDYILIDGHPTLGFQTAVGCDSKFDDGLRVMFLGVYLGDKAGFDETLAKLKSIPGNQTVVELHDYYLKVDEVLLERVPDIPGPTVKAMSRSCYIARPLAREDWSAILRKAQSAPNAWAVIDMEAYGGRINEVPVTDSAFIHRDVTMDFFADVFWEDDADRDENVAWLTNLMEFMRPYGNGHSYQNYPCRDQTDWRWAYFGPYYNTLVFVKDKFDPDRVFDYQQAIGPGLEEAHEGDYAPLLFDDPDIDYSL